MYGCSIEMSIFGAAHTSLFLAHLGPGEDLGEQEYVWAIKKNSVLTRTSETTAAVSVHRVGSERRVSSSVWVLVLLTFGFNGKTTSFIVTTWRRIFRALSPPQLVFLVRCVVGYRAQDGLRLLGKILRPTSPALTITYLFIITISSFLTFYWTGQAYICVSTKCTTVRQHRMARVALLGCLQVRDASLSFFTWNVCGVWMVFVVVKLTCRGAVVVVALRVILWYDNVFLLITSIGVFHLASGCSRDLLWISFSLGTWLVRRSGQPLCDTDVHLRF